MFQNYDSFAFMYDALKQPIKVIPCIEVEDERTGRTKQVLGEPIELEEPILNTQNPNTTFTNNDGGQLMTTVYYWESKHGEFKKGDHVYTKENHFQVTVKGDDVAGGLWYYTLKRVGDD